MIAGMASWFALLLFLAGLILCFIDHSTRRAQRGNCHTVLPYIISLLLSASYITFLCSQTFPYHQTLEETALTEKLEQNRCTNHHH